MRGLGSAGERLDNGGWGGHATRLGEVFAAGAQKSLNFLTQGGGHEHGFEAERASQLQPDDESADRIRLEAPDIVDVDAQALKAALAADNKPSRGRKSAPPAEPEGVDGAGAEDAPATDG